MLLSSLKNATPTLGFSGPDRDVCALSLDSREVKVGTLFFCIRGVKIDRHSLATAVYQKGCRAFVAEEPLPLPTDASVLLVPNARLALADMAGMYYGYPGKELTCIGITGTKGKTTTAWILTALLEKSGISVGYIGSLGAYCRKKWVKTNNTTPESLELQRLLSEMRECGVTHAVIEISSQSLAVGRVKGVRFPVTVLTGLGYDHIGPGEHQNLPAYFAAKRELFCYYPATTLIYTKDDQNAAALVAGLPFHKITAGFAEQSDYAAHSPELFWKNGRFGQRFDLVTKADAVPVTLPLPGAFNIRNALLAVATFYVLFPMGTRHALLLSEVASVLSSVRVKGHFDTVPIMKDRSFIIDYAHNGQSMTALLSLCRSYRPTRLTVLFGSVGERSRARRQELGKVAAAYADRIILTSDNPGEENPLSILYEIRAAMGHADAVLIPDRESAIRYAVRTSVPGEIVALCGKGHEQTQLVGKKNLPFSEEKILIDAGYKKRKRKRL